MNVEKPAVIIDNGSRYIKAGFSCDNHPVSMFPSVVGRPSYLNGRYGRIGRADFYDVFVGDDAVTQEDYDLSSPIENGMIVDWDNMERIWHHIYYKELKVAPEERAVIVASSPTVTVAEKVKCCQIFFEVLNAPALCIQNQASLALYASGFTTGITVDLGYDQTGINPIYEGGLIGYAHMSTGLAGFQLSSFIDNRLLERDVDLGTNKSTVLEDLVKQCVYVTKNAAMSWRDHTRPFKLSSGEIIDAFDEGFMSGELLFQPDLVACKETNFLPLHDAIMTSILKCDAELHDELLAAIVLSGGLSMIPGMGQRLQIELEEILNRGVNVVTSDESYTLAWMGAAIFAGIPEAEKVYVTKKQYEDQGARIVKTKFLVKCCQIFFEVLNAPALCIQNQASLALYASGFTTGITVDLGYDQTGINPIYEGGLIGYAHMSTGLAGFQLGSFIDNRLLERDVDLGTNKSTVLEDLVKQCVYVTKNAAMSWRDHTRPFKLSSGEIIDAFDEGFMSGELLFQPDLVACKETNFLPLHDAIMTSILKCDAELHDELLAAIVLSGGLSMIPGMGQRLQIELEEILNRGVNVVTSDESYTLAWMGAAIFAGIPEAEKVYVTKKQYEDQGARIVKTKFL